MGKKFMSCVLTAITAFCMMFLYTATVSADASQVNITTDKSQATVTVTSTDPAMNGKDVSVVCYLPGWDGNADWNASAASIAYLGQVKGSQTTSFNFKVKGGANAGEYTLVLGYTGNKITKKFSFDGNGGSTTVVTPGATSQAPAKVKAVQTAKAGVKITWDAVSGASSYDIYRALKSGAAFDKIGSSKSTSYKDKKVKAGKSYVYKIAVSGSSQMSAEAKVTLMKVPVVKAVSKGGKVILSWKKDKSAKGYKVYMSEKKKGKYKAVATIKKNKTVKATIKKVKKGRKYYFKVAAFNKNGKKKVIGKSSAVKTVKVK